MRNPAREEQFEHIGLEGKPALFTNNRIAYTTVPEGFYPYELRGSDNDPGEPVSLENRVAVNFCGTVITTEEMKFPKKKDYIPIKDKLNFLGESMSLEEFATAHSLKLAEDTRKFILHPTSEGKALFYSQDAEQDMTNGCVGHLRMDFGSSGTEFWSTWHPHNDDRLNTAEFKAELDEMVNELRAGGPLKSRAHMGYFCLDQGAETLDEHQCGFTTESEHYKYCLRCNPRKGDYNGYLYIYDKREQQLQMDKAQGVIGRTSYANGECFTHTNAESYLAEIREELEYRNTTGFRFETITDDPTVRKAVDDEVYSMFGEQNPQQIEDYKPHEISMGGM